MTQRVAVIGAGLSGLSCARILRQAGCYVDIYERDRIIGGRMATARLGMATFDHGAQYLTARSAIFRAYLEELEGMGYVARWDPRSHDGNGGQLSQWYVGTPGMSMIVRPLAESVRIHTNRTAHTLESVGESVRIWFDDQTSEGPYAAVAVAVPAPAARLLLGRMERLADAIAPVRMSPCWALMVRFDDVTMPEQDVFSDMSDVIRWIARNNSKPNRSARGETIVVHASPNWSREAEDAEPDDVAEEIWGEVCQILGLPPVRPKTLSAHLWKNGLVDESLGETCVFSSEWNVGVTGDWCIGRLGEHAFESGNRLGKTIVEAIL
ncbi:MAG: FAD-dependent oxidoreductase [Alphaproteobacteria bacterium]|nr:FAD-dependent oxidoreductase [Alphaproteobacteria bacterium]